MIIRTATLPLFEGDMTTRARPEKECSKSGQPELVALCNINLLPMQYHMLCGSTEFNNVSRVPPPTSTVLIGGLQTPTHLLQLVDEAIPGLRLAFVGCSAL
jgi:hypothetical protein